MRELPRPFIPRLGRVDECICTSCYLTIRASHVQTLSEAQGAHVCNPLDFLAVRHQPFEPE
jgi:hypothetical protein